MRTFQDSIDIAADAADLYELTQDYGRRLDWDPFLREARLLGDVSRPDVGVRAFCVSRRPRLGMETEYVSYDPPRVSAVKMTAGPWFLSHFAGSWRFQVLPDGKTRVTFSYSLGTRPPFIRPLVSAVFNREMRGRLRALKQAAEHLARGERVRVAGIDRTRR